MTRSTLALINGKDSAIKEIYGDWLIVGKGKKSQISRNKTARNSIKDKRENIPFVDLPNNK